MRTIWVYKGTPSPPVKPSVVLNIGTLFNPSRPLRPGQNDYAPRSQSHQSGERVEASPIALGRARGRIVTRGFEWFECAFG